MKRALGIIIAGLMLNGCVGKQVKYDINTVPTVDNIREYEYTIEDRLKLALNWIDKANIFNPKFEEDIINIKFYVKQEKKPKSGGYYNDLLKVIVVNFKPIERGNKIYSREDLKVISQTFVQKTIIHELLHYYFDNYLSKDEKKDFKKLVKSVDMYKEDVDSKFYNAYLRFLVKKPYYKKHYGSLFNNLFYGTEAFATLMADELNYKSNMKHTYEYLSKIKNNSELIKAKKILHYNKSKFTDELPKSILKFYKGCLNEYFFQKLVTNEDDYILIK